MTVTPWYRQIWRVGGHAGAHRVAIRAGLSVLLPLLVLLAIGHLEWSIYSAFGSFASIYGRSATYRNRFRLQSSAAIVLVLSVVVGVLVAQVADNGWLVVAVTAVWAAGVAFASDASSWLPPGPLFAVFALGAVASVPVTSSSLVIALVVSISSALLSLAIGAAGALRPAARRRPADKPVRVFDFAPAWRRPGTRRHLLRYGLATLAAGSIATGLGIGHPYWAMVAAVVPVVAVEVSQSLVRASHRVIGTFVGLLVAWGILALQPSGLGAILIVVGLQVGAELWVARNYAIALVFVTPLALTMVNLAHPKPAGTLILDRGVETVVGTIAALAVILVMHLASRPRTPRLP